MSSENNVLFFRPVDSARNNTPRMMKLFASRGMQGVNVQLFDERLGHIINEAGGVG
jgi:hypothetical protein